MIGEDEGADKQKQIDAGERGINVRKTTDKHMVHFISQRIAVVYIINIPLCEESMWSLNGLKTTVVLFYIPARGSKFTLR